MQGTKEILASTAKMMNERYDKENNVTVQGVIVNHIKGLTNKRDYMCRLVTRNVCAHLKSEGILEPYQLCGKPMRNTWRINFEKLRGYLKRTKSNE